MKAKNCGAAGYYKFYATKQDRERDFALFCGWYGSDKLAEKVKKDGKLHSLRRIR